jgi:hypothetical protein
MRPSTNNPHEEPCVKLPDEVWSRLLATGIRMPYGMFASVRLLDGKVIPDLFISNRGYVLGREMPGLAGAHGALDSSVLTFKTDDIEGVKLPLGRFWRRERWVSLNPKHPARRQCHGA